MAEKIKNLVQKITAWSYSRWTTYDQCPFKAKCSMLLKIKEPSNQAMDRGSEVHTQAQKYTEGKLKTLPPVLQSFRKDFAELKKAKALCEAQWAFNRDWKKVEWFASDCWCRIMVDAHHLRVDKVRGVNRTTVVIVDHKTGRKKDEHKEQRSLYALGAFLVYPDAVAVEASHWYLDSGEDAVDRWEAKELEALKELWVKKTEAMLNDTRFAPRPSNLCRWCYYSVNGGNHGPCKF